MSLRPQYKLLMLLAATALALVLLAFILLDEVDVYGLLFRYGGFLDKGEQIRSSIESHGHWAPLLFIGLQTLQVIFAPVPGEASGLIGGYLFGTAAGFFYSTIGLTIGSWIAFTAGRLFDDIVRRRLHQTKTYTRFNHLVSKGDYVVPFILFLLPGFPKDSLSYLLGLSSMPLPVFLFMTGVGRMPGTLMLSLQGAEAYSGNYQRLFLWTVLSMGIVFLCYFYRRPILRFLHLYQQRNNKKDKEDSE